MGIGALLTYRVDVVGVGYVLGLLLGHLLLLQLLQPDVPGLVARLPPRRQPLLGLSEYNTFIINRQPTS